MKIIAKIITRIGISMVALGLTLHGKSIMDLDHLFRNK